MSSFIKSSTTINGITYYDYIDSPTNTINNTNSGVLAASIGSNINVVFGLGGNDTITSAGGNNFIYGGDFTTTFTGNDTITINSGTSSNYNYIVTPPDPSNASVTVYGNSQNMIVSGTGNTTVTVTTTSGTVGSTTIDLGPGNDTATLGAGNDVALLNVPLDGAYNDNFNGGAGTDVLRLAFANATQMTTFATKFASLSAFDSTDSMTLNGGSTYNFGKFSFGFPLNLKATGFEQLTLDVNPTAVQDIHNINVGFGDLTKAAATSLLANDISSVPVINGSTTTPISHPLSLFSMSNPVSSDPSHLTVTADYNAFTPTLLNPLSGEFSTFDLTPVGSTSHALLTFFNDGTYSITNMAAIGSVVLNNPGMYISFNYTNADGYGGHGNSTAKLNLVADHDVITAIAHPVAQSATEGTAFSLSNSGIFGTLFTHTEVNDTYSLVVSGLPSGLTYDSSGIHGTPTDLSQAQEIVGPYTITVTATNTDPNELTHTSATNNFTINVADAQDTVSYVQTADQVATEGTTFSVAPVFSHLAIESDDHLVYTATGLPNGLTIDSSTGIISGIPTDLNGNEIVGTYTISVTATNMDPGNLVNGVHPSATDIFKIVVGDAQDAISFTQTADQVATEGSAFSVAPVFSHLAIESDDPLVYTATGLPNGLTINSSTGKISGIPTDLNGNEIVGTYTVSVTATNTNDGISSLADTFKIVVGDAQDVISFTQTADQVATEGSAFSVAPVFSHLAIESDDPLVYTATGLPNGLTIDPNTGIISGTPTDLNGNEIVGTYTVSVTATNTNDGITSLADTFKIVVADAPDTVTYTQTPNQTITEGQNFSVAILLPGDIGTPAYSLFSQSPTEAEDGLVYSVSYAAVTNGVAGPSISGLPTGFALTPAPGNGLLVERVLFDDSQIGTYQITITATNPDLANANDPGHIANDTFLLTVKDSPNEVIAKLITTPISFNIGEGLSYDSSGIFNASSLFRTDDPLNYAADPAHPLPNGLSIDPISGNISGTPIGQGTYTVDIIATNMDPHNAGDLPVTSNTFTINVEAPIAPTKITLGGQDVSASSFALSVPTLKAVNTVVGSFDAIAPNAPSNEAFTYSLSENNNDSSDTNQYFSIDSNGNLILQHAFLPFNIYNPITLTVTATPNGDSSLSLTKSFTTNIQAAPTQILPSISHITVVAGNVGVNSSGHTITGNNTLSLGNMISTLTSWYTPPSATQSTDAKLLFASPQFDQIASIIPDPNFYTNLFLSDGNTATETVTLATGITMTNPDADSKHPGEFLVNNDSYLTFDSSLGGTSPSIHVEARDIQNNILPGDTIGSNDIAVPINVDTPSQAASVILNIAVPSVIAQPVTLTPIATVTVDTTSPTFAVSYTGSVIIDNTISNPTMTLVQTNGQLSNSIGLTSLTNYQGTEFPGNSGSGHYLAIDLTNQLGYVQEDVTSQTTSVEHVYGVPLSLFVTSTGSYALFGDGGIGLGYDPSNTLGSMLPLSGITGGGFPYPHTLHGTIGGVTLGVHNGINDLVINTASTTSTQSYVSQTVMDFSINHMTLNEISTAATNLSMHTSQADLAQMGIFNHADAMNYIENSFVPTHTVALIANTATHALVGIEVISYGGYTDGNIIPGTHELDATPVYASLLQFGNSSTNNLYDTTAAAYKSPGGTSYTGLGGWLETLGTKVTPTVDAPATGFVMGHADTTLSDFAVNGAAVVEATPFVPAIVHTTDLPQSSTAQLFSVSNPYGGQDMLLQAQIAVIEAAVVVLTAGIGIAAAPALTAALGAAEAVTDASLAGVEGGVGGTLLAAGPSIEVAGEVGTTYAAAAIETAATNLVNAGVITSAEAATSTTAEIASLASANGIAVAGTAGATSGIVVLPTFTLGVTAGLAGTTATSTTVATIVHP